jgi:outer membrane protein, heavy metal efflux system
LHSTAHTGAAKLSRHAEDADRSGRRPALRRRGAAALGLLIGALTGCATYTPAPLDPTRSAGEFGARRLDAPGLREQIERVLPQAAVAWPPEEWDRAQLLAVALVQNRQLAVARAEIEAALAHEIGANEIPNPALGLQGEYARREPEHWLYGISFDFLLRQHGTRRLGVDIARLETAGARAQLMERTWSVRRALVAALSDGESARRRLEILTRLAAAQDRLIAARRQRVVAGEDVPGDLALADATRIEIEQQQAQARMDVASAQAAAAAALGMPPAALDGVTIAWPDWGAPPALDGGVLQAAREQALLSRADLAAAIGEYAQAEKKLELSVARQYPQFEFSPGYYWDHGIAKWPLDVAFTLPLFNRNEGEIAEATAAREVAAQRMLALQATIYGDIESAARAEQVARGNIDAAERRVDAAQQQRQHADLALRLGAVDSIEHAGADAFALRAELETVQARAQAQAARNALEDALHAPLSGPELMLALSSPSADPGADR